MRRLRSGLHSSGESGKGNPLIYIDPSGHIFGFIAAIIIGAIVGGAMAAATGGDIGKGILFGALGGALTAGISSAIFSTVTVSTLAGKAAVYAVSAFATSATIGAIQGVRGSDLWRSAGISAGVAFAATMVIGSISDAAKNGRAASNLQAAELGQAEVAKGRISGDTTLIESGSESTVPQGVDPAGKGVTGIVNEGGGSNILAGASQGDKSVVVLTTDVASTASSSAPTASEPWYVSAYKIIESAKVIIKSLIEIMSGSPAFRLRPPQTFLLPKKVLEEQIRLYKVDPI